MKWRLHRFLPLVILLCRFQIAIADPQSVHLAMDDRMFKEWGHSLQNMGCYSTSDAVIGEAMLVEKRSLIVFSNPLLDWLGKGDFTISLWMKMDPKFGEIPWFTTAALDGCSVILSKGLSSGILIGVVQGKINVGVFREGDLEEEVKYIYVPHRNRERKINDNCWHFLVVLSREDEFEVWVDGVLEWNTTVSNPIDFSNKDSMQIGASDDGRQCLTGILDEFRFDPRAWSSAEIHEEFLRVFPKRN